MPLVETKELELAGSDLAVLLVRDLAMVEEGFLLSEAFFSAGCSGVGDLYLYSMKSGSLS
jgi:hypothetical protein